MKNPVETLTVAMPTVEIAPLKTGSIRSSKFDDALETASQSTSLPSFDSVGEFEKAGQVKEGEYEGPINLDDIDDFSLSSELDHLKTIVESTRKRNRKSLHEELKALWEGLQEKETDLQLESNVLVSSDSDSIYETEESPAETVFRSKSYDEFVGINKDPKVRNEDALIADEKDKKDQLKNEEETHKEKFKMNETVDIKGNCGSLSKSHCDNEAEPHMKKNLDQSSFCKSMTSEQEAAVEASFSDILSKDINHEQSLRNPNETPDALLRASDEQIIQLIVEQLKRELEPTLAQLTKESEKYQILKKLYKLPSISNLNTQMKQKYKRGSKKFRLEFDENVIQELIDKKRTELDSHLKTHILLPQDQVKLNFNKFRRLNTISEDIEVKANKSLQSVTSGQKTDVLDRESQEHFKRIDVVLEYECQKARYCRTKDNRQVKDLSLGELKAMQKMLWGNHLKDISRVKQICGLFERDIRFESRPIGKIPNSVLGEEISREITKRL